jgi:adenylate kinase family enzyme
MCFSKARATRPLAKEDRDCMKVWIVGSPGSGKSVIGRQLAERLRTVHHELDTDYWMADWVIRPREEFEQLVSEAAASCAWVIDGNYVAAAPILSQKADILLWIDLPFFITYPRVLRRTWERITTQQEIWHGNRESWQNTLNKDGMPCYALFKHRRNQERIRRYWDSFVGPKKRLTRPRHVLQDAIEGVNVLQ